MPNGYNKPLDSVTKVKSLHNTKQKYSKKSHKVIMIGDSFFRGAAENVRTFLNEKCDVFGVVKPGAGLSEITQSLKNDVLKLTFKDTLVLSGGTINLDRYKYTSALKLITKFVTSNNHTNIILLCVPHRYDLHNHSNVNIEIRKYNRGLFKIAQAYNHIKILELHDRGLFTKHGLHFNKLGKVHLVKQIVSTAQSLFDKDLNPPIVMGWLSDTSVNKEFLVEETVSETSMIVQNMNTHVLESCNDDKSIRTSKRTKKPPLTRSNYFLW